MAVNNIVKAEELLYMVYSGLHHSLAFRDRDESPDVHYSNILGRRIYLVGVRHDASKDSLKEVGNYPGNDISYHMEIGEEMGFRSYFIFSAVRDPYLVVRNKVISGNDILDFATEGYQNVLKGSRGANDTIGFLLLATAGAVSPASVHNVSTNCFMNLATAYQKGLTSLHEYASPAALCYDALADILLKNRNEATSEQKESNIIKTTFSCVAQRERSGGVSLKVRLAPAPSSSTRVRKGEPFAWMECKSGEKPTGTYSIDDVTYRLTDLTPPTSIDELTYTDFLTSSATEKVAYLYYMLPYVLAKSLANPLCVIPDYLNRGDIEFDYGKAYRRYSK